MTIPDFPARSLQTALCLVAALAARAAADTTVTFDNGTEGWSSTAFIDPNGGNPGANYHIVNPDTFGIILSNTTNPEFVGDYTASPSVTLRIDVRVDDISFFGSPVSRPWLVDLRDTDAATPASVWFKFADISAAATGNWTTFEVTIEDTSAADLPPGWGGTGDETPLGEPILPANRTFTDVLAGVDQIVFTTFEPGFVYGFTAFDFRVDNIAIESAGAVPASSEWGLGCLALLLVGGGAAVLRRRGPRPA